MLSDLINIKFLNQIKEACADEVCFDCPLMGDEKCLLKEPPAKWDCGDIFEKAQDMWRE